MTYEQKRATIEQLLDHWQDFFEKASSGGLVTISDDKPMSKDWTILSSMSRHKSVLELLRVLGLARKHMPRRYSMLMGFYGCDTRTTTIPIKRRDARGRMVDDVQRVRERVLTRQLAREPLCREPGCPCGGRMPEIVCYAHDALLGLWSGAVVLELPAALNRRLREFTDQDGTHLTEAA